MEILLFFVDARNQGGSSTPYIIAAGEISDVGIDPPPKPMQGLVA